MDDSMDNNMDEEPAIDTARSRLPSIDQLLQVTPVSPAIGANTPPFGFDPLLYDIEPHVWTTDLDRILVLCVKLDGTVTIWFRLIGPRQTLNLKLNAIVSGSPVATLEVTTGSVPKTHQNLTDYNVVTRGCFFADPYAFIYQHSLDKWTFSGHTTQERCIEVSLWASCICACLAPQDAFALTECFTGEAPPSFCSTSRSTAPHPFENSIVAKGVAWTSYASWRLNILTQTYLEDLRSTESRMHHTGRVHSGEEHIDTAAFNDHFQKMGRWRQCISTARQRDQEECDRGNNIVDLCYEVMLELGQSLDGLKLQ